MPGLFASATVMHSFNPEALSQDSGRYVHRGRHCAKVQWPSSYYYLGANSTTRIDFDGWNVISHTQMSEAEWETKRLFGLLHHPCNMV